MASGHNGGARRASARSASLAVIAAAAVVAGAGDARGAEPASAALRRVEPSRLVVEAGALEALGDDAFALRRPGVRAIAPRTRGSAARIEFTYRGPTRDAEPLASGELRRQIGLKLRAQDTCNVVYVMWHVAPTTGLQVQVKSNPGKRTHAECRDGGYRTLASGVRVPPIREGERHALAARLDGKRLTVLADGVLAWVGQLPDEAFAADGPAGFRSDNGAFDAEFSAEPVSP